MRRSFLISGLAGCMLIPGAQAITFQHLHHFESPPYSPTAELAMGSDGWLYGPAYSGGAHGQGAIFKITTNGAFSTAWSFTGGADGAFPNASLVSASDGFLYGTASRGGISDYGVIFKLSTTGILTPLYAFTNYSEGAQPQGGLIQGTDGSLYGVTTYGGSNYYGTVFRITTGGMFTNLWSFTGGLDGEYPYARLAQGSDGALYGTCNTGGSNDLGTVYRITTNGVMTPLWSFTGGADGASPYGHLAAGPGGILVGQTRKGGTNDYGAVFKITTSGVLTPLWSFTYSGSDGGQPFAGMLRATNGWYYGVASGGGTNYAGTLFKIATNGTMTPLWSFRYYPDGAYPYSGLFQAPGGAFYGTTQNAGSNSLGTVYRFVEGTGLAAIWHFQGAANGSYPLAALMRGADGAFYGTTYNGGSNYNNGTVFRMDSSGTLTRLFSFGGEFGCNPTAELLTGAPDPGVVCYGTTTYCGDYGNGTAFLLRTNGIMEAYSFPYSPTNAATPFGGIVRGPEGAFYGTTYYGGTSNLGAVYSISTGGVEKLLHSFTGPDGRHAIGTLARSNHTFYGVTEQGGVSNRGTVFRIATNGAFATLWHFTGQPDGERPKAGVILGRDGALYGTTEAGGSNNAGTVFRLTTNGTLTILKSFNWDDHGSQPQAPLIQGKDGALYGTTVYDGSNYYGTIFRITTNGQFNALWSFTGGTQGGNSRAGLLEDGHWFYGTSTLNDGTIFRFSLAPILYQAAPGGAAARVLMWDELGYLLQTTTNLLSGYSFIVPATSPYTNTFTDRIRFFRLHID